MRRSSLRPSSLALVLGLSLACSSGSREAEPETAIESEPAASPVAAATDEPRVPTVGTPAPALALDSLSGERVQLPVKNTTRAAVLIFGSFS